jgi:hypothetical protein
VSCQRIAEMEGGERAYMRMFVCVCVSVWGCVHVSVRACVRACVCLQLCASSRLLRDTSCAPISVSFCARNNPAIVVEN